MNILTEQQIADFRERLTAWSGTDDAPNPIIEDYAEAAGIPEADRVMQFSLPVRMHLLSQHEAQALDVEGALAFMAAMAAVGRQMG